MHRSPIQMMVDKACGFDPNNPPPPPVWPVTMRCPVCLKEKGAPKHKTDPKGTVVVEFPCDDCADHREGASPKFYDKDGKPLA